MIWFHTATPALQITAGSRAESDWIIFSGLLSAVLQPTDAESALEQLNKTE